MKNFIKVILICSIFAISTSASAYTWLQNGVWVSDTCRNQYGAWFQFDNYYGIVGNSCSWVINGYVYYGIFRD